jgi:outer membrane biosynthesis protein TonB
MALLLAAPAGHRARAERAEALGRMAEAAREYEAAWEEEQAPELLYRLGLARRKLKEYGKAREAFRAYLRAAPQGGLRGEVERQLAKLEILIEAQREDYSDAAPERKRSPPKSTPSPPEPVVAQPAPIVAAPAPAPPPPAPAPALAPAPAPAPALAPVPAPAPAPTPAPPAALAAPAPELTLSSPVAPPARSRAPLWLAGGAAAAFASGAVLWWDGARISRDLDARFAAGDLAAADRPLFGRARGESIAGRALVVAGAGLLAAAAVALWW